MCEVTTFPTNLFNAKGLVRQPTFYSSQWQKAGYHATNRTFYYF